MARHSILLLTEKGGVGKTTIAIPLVDHLLATAAGYVVVDADCQSADETTRSSLSAFFPSARRMAIAASPNELKAKPALALSHWDALYEAARASDLIVDFGANVAGSLVSWLDQTK